MILIYKKSNEYNSRGVDPEDLESGEDKISYAMWPLYSLVGYLERSFQIAEVIKSIYLKNYESYGTVDQTISNFDGNAAQSEIIKSIIPKFNLFTEKSWRKIISSSKKYKIVFVAERIEKAEAEELQKIAPENLEILIQNFKITDVKRFLEIIVESPDIENTKIKKVVFGEDQNRINLFQSKSDINLPKDGGFVIYLNTDDELLSEFLIMDINKNKRIFYHSAKDYLDGLEFSDVIEDAYDTLVINDFNCISPQRQNNLWSVIKGMGFDKKIVVLCGMDSKVIPEIKNRENYYSTEYFNFKNIKKGLINFLCYYYQKSWQTNSFRYSNKFENYYDVSERLVNEILFKADNFVILNNSMQSAHLRGSSDLVDPMFLYQLEKKITKLNHSWEEKKNKADQYSKPPQYIWKFRGDFWEISFGYKEPILVRDNASIFYLACLMEQPGVVVKIDALKTASTSGGTASGVTSNLQWLRNYKKEIIDIIKEKEDQLELGNDLSEYLGSAKWVVSEKGTSIWDYPITQEKDIKWEIFRPKYYFIKEKGKLGLQNETKKPKETKKS
jgi:hypothetical protein